MKRYLVFTGDHYYPLGGMEDFDWSTDDKEEAISSAKDSNSDDDMWGQVYDMKTQSVIFNNFNEEDEEEYEDDEGNC